MIRNRALYWIRRNAPDIVAALCAAFMLCALPLLFHDAFFDINRFKVKAVYSIIPPLTVLMFAALLFAPGKRERFRLGQPGQGSAIAMLCLLTACIVSSALAGFEDAVLTGSEGRYCGLYFMLCCGDAYFIISTGRLHFRLLMPAILLCAAVCAGLGFINAIGFDPLDFYDRIQKGQETVFLSTIGHFDFFGTFLVLMFSLAGAQFVFSERKGMRLYALFCSLVIALGAMASRTDSAFAGLHMVCFLLVALSGGSYSRFSRSIALWGACFLALPVTYVMLSASIYKPEISGLPKILYDMRAGQVMSILLFLLAAACAVLSKSRIPPPKRKTVLSFMLLLFAAVVLLAFFALIYFSVFDIETDLGGAASFLRFNDRWGSLRGFVYKRSLRAFADFAWPHKLFGAGMELTLRVLKPYFDDPTMLVYGVFNDPHCQPLQMLLTCGVFGMASFAALYAVSLITLFRHAGDDPVLCGVLCALWGYSIIMLINVTQPILIATYFSVIALGVSRIRALKREKGGVHES